MSRTNDGSSTPPSDFAEADAMLAELRSQVREIDCMTVETIDAIQDPDRDLTKRLDEEIAAHDKMGVAVIACQRREGILTRRLVSALINHARETRRMVTEMQAHDAEKARREKEDREENAIFKTMLVAAGFAVAFGLGLWGRTVLGL